MLLDRPYTAFVSNFSTNSRGEDTRKNFTDHLYAALVEAGYSTYKDDEEIEIGRQIRSELLIAIQKSRVVIVVFSKDFASSGWCLDELLMILEHKRTSGLVVIPVFYHVDKIHVSNQTGCVADSFSRHEERFSMENGEGKFQLREKVSSWRAALKEFADISTDFSTNQFHGREPTFIRKIVEAVALELNVSAFPAVPYQLASGESSNASIMCIWGMGGIGKTTMARFVYNLNYDYFEAASFLPNISEEARHCNGLVRLQERLLSDISLKKKPEKFNNFAEGLIRISEVLACKRVLIVLDDVDCPDQLDVLLGMQDSIYPGSKIIVTTRHKRLLRRFKYYVHEVEKLNDEESVELFSLHAFGQCRPFEGFELHVDRVVKFCDGLPLALKLTAAVLSGRNREKWSPTLTKMEYFPHCVSVSIHKISFDSLHDDHDKNLFLDIACFFVGKNKNYVVRVLDACGYFAELGIENLIERSLLSVSDDNRLMMHRSLQDMGRDIVGKESSERGSRSRLWNHEDALHVLSCHTGTKEIEGLVFNRQGNLTRNSKRRHSDAFPDKSSPNSVTNPSKWYRLGPLSWFPKISHLLTSPASSDEYVIEVEAFSRMSNLRLLKLNDVQLAGRNFAEFPQKLAWLCWRGFSKRSLPANLPINDLAVLDMRYSNMKQVWDKTKFLPKLKIINLSHSLELTSTPDFTSLPNLEDLILKDCISLTEVHASVMGLERLRLLNLKGCIKLRKLPRDIRRLQSLEELNLSGCLNLNEELYRDDL